MFTAEMVLKYLSFCRQCSRGIVIIENKWTAGMVLNNLKYIYAGEMVLNKLSLLILSMVLNKLNLVALVLNWLNIRGIMAKVLNYLKYICWLMVLDD